MKKLLLMMFAMMTFGAAAAVAQDGTFNLAWAICRVAASTGTANDRVPVCDGSDAALSLIATFQPTNNAIQFGGATVEFTVGFGGTPVPDAWDISGAGCNAGGLANVNVANLANCGNPYTGSTQGGGTYLDAVGGGKVRYGADWGRVSVGEVALAGIAGNVRGYTAQKINFAVDIAGANLCAGCTDGACIVLNKVIWGSQTSGQFTAIAPLDRDHVTLNGGGANCPGGTPTKAATWGQVKALYR